jgi:hypothetical protein
MPHNKPLLQVNTAGLVARSLYVSKSANCEQHTDWNVVYLAQPLRSTIIQVHVKNTRQTIVNIHARSRP